MVVVVRRSITASVKGRYTVIAVHSQFTRRLKQTWASANSLPVDMAGAALPQAIAEPDATQNMVPAGTPRHPRRSSARPRVPRPLRHPHLQSECLPMLAADMHSVLQEAILAKDLFGEIVARNIHIVVLLQHIVEQAVSLVLEVAMLHRLQFDHLATPRPLLGLPPRPPVHSVRLPRRDQALRPLLGHRHRLVQPRPSLDSQPPQPLLHSV
ncbi:hypothetical protein IQ07DRAFT_250651 [Pyrenochaeta sp. DS3sAY3a]|nr:hypothetical protein IQ07DRAFT_250651 [Pyrenochaeta sp. DS3sAY3a]